MGTLTSDRGTLEKDKRKVNALVTASDHSSRSITSKTPDTFKPFASQGFISMKENSAEMKAIQILCDTGAS